MNPVIIGSATLYLGDYLEILPTLPKVDAVIADPPYGIGYVNGAINIQNATKFSGVAVIGDDVAFDPAPLLAFPDVCLWGANHFADRLPIRDGRWLVWDKRCGIIPERDTSDFEMAWARGSGGKADRMFRLFWDGFNKQTERGVQRDHPMQKPVDLMLWCMKFYPTAQTILDSFMGSGTTGVACMNLGRRFIGIEIEEKYFDIACERIENAQRQLRMFA